MGRENLPGLRVWGALILGGIVLLSCTTVGGTTTLPQIPLITDASDTPLPTTIESIQPSPPISCEEVVVANPAATYCVMLGYQVGVQETQDGQVSICTLPDGTVCDAWKFLRGTCGQEFSWCAINGYQIQNVIQSDGLSTQEYAVCVDANGNTAGSVIELSGLQTLLESCLPR